MTLKKPLLPPSRPVFVHLPLTLIEQLDYVATTHKVPRSNVIRRALFRDVSTLLDSNADQPDVGSKKWSLEWMRKEETNAKTEEL